MRGGCRFALGGTRLPAGACRGHGRGEGARGGASPPRRRRGASAVRLAAAIDRRDRSLTYGAVADRRARRVDRLSGPAVGRAGGSAASRRSVDRHARRARSARRAACARSARRRAVGLRSASKTGVRPVGHARAAPVDSISAKGPAQSGGGGLTHSHTGGGAAGASTASASCLPRGPLSPSLAPSSTPS